MIARIVLLILVAASGYLLPWWLFLPCAILYGLRYTALELILLGAMLDGASGLAARHIPLPMLYTLMTLLIAIGGEALRPYLRVSAPKDRYAFIQEKK